MRKFGSGALLLITGAIVASAAVLAQSAGGDFELIQSTIDSGGGEATGAEYELVATIAQSEADPQQSSGGDFLLAGGFWASANEAIFSNGFEGN